MLIQEEQLSLNLLINYAGSEDEVAPVANAFLELADASVVNASVPYAQVPSVSGTGADTPLCAPSSGRHPLVPVQLNNTNTATMRAVYNLLSKSLAANPDLQGGLAVESYGAQAVRSTPSESTAFPWRGDNIYAYVYQ